MMPTNLNAIQAIFINHQKEMRKCDKNGYKNILNILLNNELKHIVICANIMRFSFNRMMIMMHDEMREHCMRFRNM